MGSLTTRQREGPVRKPGLLKPYCAPGGRPGVLLLPCGQLPPGVHPAVRRRITINVATPEQARTMAAVSGSTSLPPVSGSGFADAEALAEALAEVLAEALAVAPVSALSCTRSTSRLSA